jgi:hypothetical protein
MESAIQDLVRMKDVESLYEIMTENDDFMLCLDAAEGLVTLGDMRGVEFLQDAAESEDEDIKEVAEEILASPAFRQIREDMEAKKRQERMSMREMARKRLQKGKSIFVYKTIYLPVTDFASGDISDDGQNVEALNEFGGDGWEVAAFFANPEATTPITISGKLTGGYFLLKKEVQPDEAPVLDTI